MPSYRTTVGLKHDGRSHDLQLGAEADFHRPVDAFLRSINQRSSDLTVFKIVISAAEGGGNEEGSVVVCDS